MEQHNDRKIQKEIGRRFKEAVKTAGLTAKDVAEALGLSNERSVSQWYRGEREIRPSFLAILSEKFKINPAYVLAGYGTPLLSDIAAMDSKKKPSFSKKEEEIFRERHPYIVAVLENVFDPWKIIPKAAIENFSVDLKEILASIKKILKNPPKVAHQIGKAGKMVYSFGAELPGEALFFFMSPYWRYCVRSLWRFYWSLALERNPLSQDLATVGALYYREDNFLEAANRLVRLLNKEKMWSVDEKAIQKEKFPFKPDQSIEPETLRFLRFAAYDLIDLYLKDELPSFCLAHHKVHWAGCPVCEKED